MIKIIRRLRAIWRRTPQIFLASREDMFHVNRLLQDIPAAAGSAYIGIVGGMGTLNVIEKLRPRSIVLVDSNTDQLAYGACIVELIALAASRREFVESVFSRPFREDEAAFLGQQGDAAIFASTLTKISRKKAFRRFFSPIRDAGFSDGLEIRDNRCCRRLRLHGPERGTPEYVNFFFYGQGWLENDERFAALKKTLAAARITFIRAAIETLKLDVNENHVYFHGSNVFSSYPKQYWRFVAGMHRRLAGRDRSFTHFSTYQPVSTTQIAAPRPLAATIHADCAAKVAVHTQGKRVLEVIPGRHYFGREMKAADHEVVHFSKLDPLGRSFEMVVSHILYGSGLLGLTQAKFQAFLAKALALAPEIVIVEHNRRSLDFRGGRRLDLEDLILLLGGAGGPGLKVRVDFARGRKDDMRNLVMHVRR
ncbi:MAG TPA: hypothetical protein VLQ89_08490 [Candidatus Binatia bacterium]|nr:hypothetical protein [Candidatus Binatia bacterium]